MSPTRESGTAVIDEDQKQPIAHTPEQPQVTRIHSVKAALIWFHSGWPSLSLAALLLVGWAVAVPLFDIKPYILPGPGAVVAAAFDPEAQWGVHILTTVQEVAGGFCGAFVAGVLLGTAIAWSKWARRALMPLLVFINILPKVALAPLFLVWIGYGILPTIFIAALLTFFPLVINTSEGLVQIDDDLIDLARSMGAPKWKIFAKVRFPNALPYVFSAMKVAITMSVTGTVIGEFVAAQNGLGFVVQSVQTSLQTNVALASILWLSIIGLLFYGLIELLTRLIAPWAYRA